METLPQDKLVVQTAVAQDYILPNTQIHFPARMPAAE